MVLASLIVSTVMDAVVIVRVIMQTVDNQGVCERVEASLCYADKRW